MSMDALYDTIGRSYADTRRPDPRIAAAIERALDGSSAVVNVGAGAGSYEPPQTRWAIEPSQTMIDQRRPGAAPAIRSTAERIPLADGEADAALAVLTIHHWSDLEAGIAEMRRVAAGRVVILTWDPVVGTSHWLSRDYLPELAAWDATRFLPIEDVAALMGGAETTVVPIPHDCTDGFMGAFWRRPEAYLDPVLTDDECLRNVSAQGMKYFQFGPSVWPPSCWRHASCPSSSPTFTPGIFSVL